MSSPNVNVHTIKAMSNSELSSALKTHRGGIQQDIQREINLRKFLKQWSN